MKTAQSRSADLFERARTVIAGGVDSPVRAGGAVGSPPPLIARAHGSRIIDVDGREYIDYLFAYGPMLLGHSHRAITAAVARALQDGAVFGATHPEEIRLAERIATLMPSMERLRFVSTGTEACMSAVRVARAFTGRERIARLRGNYHGHGDEMIFSAGASSESTPTLACGVASAVVDGVLVLPYNDADAIERSLEAKTVAALIMEPIAGNMGLVLPEDGYLAHVREACTRTDTVLIFDEVITGFRVGLAARKSATGYGPISRASAKRWAADCPSRRSAAGARSWHA